MPLNIKHQTAIALATAASAICLIGLLKSDSDQPNYPQLTTIEQLAEINNRLSAKQPPSNSAPITDIKALPHTPDQTNDFIAPVTNDDEKLVLAPEMRFDSFDNDTTLLAERKLEDEADSSAAMEAINSTESLSLQSEPHFETGLAANLSTAQTQSTNDAVSTASLWQANQPSERPATAIPKKQTNDDGVKPLVSLNTQSSPTLPTAAQPKTSRPTQNVAIATETTPIADAPRPALTAPITPARMRLSEASAIQAVHHIEYGKSLSRRGAAMAARQEFFAALRVIAQANDSVVGGNDFSQSLGHAIRAMKEAEDFSINQSADSATVNVAATIESHRTQLLTKNEARHTSPVQAMQRYYAFAQQQLDFAGGRNVVTAEALSCLGKLHTVMARHQKIMPGNLDVAKAIVFQKTSLMSNPNNPTAANELGVLMVKTGQLREATELFKQSLIAQPTPQAWQNLANTHRRLGELEMAQLADLEYSIASQSRAPKIASGIQWIQAPQFNAMTPLEFEPRVAAQTQFTQPSADEFRTSEPNGAPKSFGDRIKAWF